MYMNIFRKHTYIKHVYIYVYKTYVSIYTYTHKSYIHVKISGQIQELNSWCFGGLVWRLLKFLLDVLWCGELFKSNGHVL